MGILQILLNSMQFIAIISLATLGIVLIFQTSITTNFAQSMIATVGGFISVTLLTKYGVPALASYFIAVAAMFLFGVFIDAVIIRFARHVTPVGKQMLTMGIVLLLTGLIPLVFGNVVMQAPKFSNTIITNASNTLSFSMHNLIGFILAAVVIAAIFICLKFTKWGLSVRATASNETVAKMMGINTRIITGVSWGIAGAVGTLAALIYAPLTQITPTMMVSVQVQGFMACVLGGFTSFIGPIVGAIIIPVLRNIVGYLGADTWKDVVVYLVIFLVVLIKPMGLFGKKIVKKV
ncbi:MAG: branched-chain amino acid ABC transporter permease [Bacilli bacterium]|nr:branched-chain amino acid ABC transporter permease [Bacilli bacterium]